MILKISGNICPINYGSLDTKVSDIYVLYIVPEIQYVTFPQLPVKTL